MLCCCVAEREGFIVVPQAATLDDKSCEDDSTDILRACEDDSTVTKTESQAFMVTLTRETAQLPWGLLLDLSSNAAIHVSAIRAVGDSPVAVYNAQAPEDKQLKEGDYITAVNGVLCDALPSQGPHSSADALGEELKNSVTMTMHVKHPYVYSVQIHKGGGIMGLDLNYTTSCATLAIERIGDGAVKKAAPEVRVGDRIVAVNGQLGHPHELLETITQNELVVLTLSRPS